MDNNTTTRRAMLAALGATGALALTVPAIATATLPGANCEAWDQALANLKRCRGAFEAQNKVWDRIRPIWKAGRPSKDAIHWKEFAFRDRDHVARVIDAEKEFQQWLAEEGRLWQSGDRGKTIARKRAAYDSVLEFRRAEEAHRRDTGYGEASERLDALADAVCSAEAVLMEMPAPHAEALLWKLNHLFGPDACDPDGASPSWSGSYFQPFIADCHRLLSNGRA